MLVPNEWQHTPGLDGAAIYPLLVSSGIHSSNSYLVESDDCLLLIDPGGLRKNAERLLGVIGERMKACPRSLVLMVTHCHVDHMLGIEVFNGSPVCPDTGFAFHERGAEILAKGDLRLCLAELYGYTSIPCVSADIVLLGSDARSHGFTRTLCVGAGLNVDIHSTILEDCGETPWYMQNLNIGRHMPVEIYHTPGHSPDSLCIRIGRVFFIGDILAASAPLVAGVPGWDRDELFSSASHLLCFLERNQDIICCPGHGAVMDVNTAMKLLRRVQGEVSAMDEPAEVNSVRVGEARTYALQLMDELDATLTVMSGRLEMLAHRLHQLDEPEAAEDVRQRMDVCVVEKALIDFHQCARSMHVCELFNLELVLKAVSLVRRILKTLEKARLGDFLNEALVRRAARLLVDFMAVVRGVSPARDLSRLDLARTIHSFLEEIRDSPHADTEAVMKSLDDPDAFLAVLTARITHVPVLDNVIFDADIPEVIPPVSADRERLCDTLQGLLELMAVMGATRIRFDAEQAGGYVRLNVSGDVGLTYANFSEQRHAVYERHFTAAGCRFSYEPGRDKVCFAVVFRRASGDSEQDG